MRRPMHPGRHFGEHILRLRSFFLSFSLSLLAMTAILAATLVCGGFWELNRSPGKETEKIVQAAETASNIPISPLASARAEDGLTVLIMGTKDAQSVPNTYLLLRFDPLKGRIPVTSLPPQTMVVKPQGDQTPLPLTEVYRFGSHALTVQALENTFGFPIDRYVVVDIGSFLEIGKLVGPVQYLLGQELDYRDAERSIRLSRGTQLVDGQKAVDIVTYPAYPGGEEFRAEMTASLAVQIINRKLSLSASPGAEQLFKAIINRVDTNITFLDFEERRTFLAELERLTPAFQIYPEGELNAEGTGYTLNESGIRMLCAYMK